MGEKVAFYSLDMTRMQESDHLRLGQGQFWGMIIYLDNTSRYLPRSYNYRIIHCRSVANVWHSASAYSAISVFRLVHFKFKGDFHATF